MNFDTLNTLIPKGREDEVHTNTMYLSGGFGWSVRVRFPGKYGPDDFVIEALSEDVWDDYHPFRHGDLFADVSAKFEHSPNFIKGDWSRHVLEVIKGEAKPRRLYPVECELPGIHLDALTNVMLALAVCEYRRYPKGDKRGGGRYLPVNYMLAMLQGHWDASDATKQMRVGFPALRKLDDFTPFTHQDNAVDYVNLFHT